MSFLFQAPDPRFAPSQSVVDEADSLLFAFRGHDLVHREGPLPLPTVAEARAAGLEVPTVTPLGLVDGRPAVLAVLPKDAAIPSGLLAASVRRLFFTLEGGLMPAAALASQLAHFEATSRFCSSCGVPLERRPGERARRCGPCAREVYAQVAPCVIVLVHDGDRVLLARGPRMPPSMYALIAGFVEPGESLETCVRREVLEETALVVEDVEYVGSQPWPFPSQLMTGFLARAAGGELRPDPAELEDARWFSVTELPTIPPPFTIARFLIDHYVERARRGGR